MITVSVYLDGTGATLRRYVANGYRFEGSVMVLEGVQGPVDDATVVVLSGVAVIHPMDAE